MVKRLLNTLDEKILEELDSHDFELVKEEKSGSFDNELLIFESQELEVRIARDRGDVSIQVSSEDLGNQWLELPAVLKLIDPGKLPEPKMDDLLKALLVHQKTISFLLEEGQKEETLEQIKKNRIEANRKFFESRGK